MIAKVQRPIGGGDPDGGPDILVYAKGREHLRQVRFSDLPTWLCIALADCPKVYVFAVFDRDGWTFGSLAPEQAW